MILKVEIEKALWQYHDNIVDAVIDHQVLYKKGEGLTGRVFQKKFDLKDNEVCRGYSVISDYLNENQLNHETGIGRCRVLEGFDSKNRVVCIAFDTPAYLMNDEGKTIQKL